MAPAELVAAGFGFAYILLAIRQHRACWIAGAIGTAIYAKVFLDAGLPMQAALQVVYVAMSAYGFFAWRRDQDQAAPVRRWSVARHLLALAAVGLATAVSAPLAARHALSAAPIAESLGTWASILGDLAAGATGGRQLALVDRRSTRVSRRFSPRWGFLVGRALSRLCAARHRRMAQLAARHGSV